VRRHSLDAVSLATGTAFAGLGALLIGNQVDLVVRLRWGWPLLFIAIAVVMLASVGLERRGAPGPAAGAETWAVPGRPPEPGATAVDATANAGKGAPTRPGTA
jgi:hypothetical protein